MPCHVRLQAEPALKDLLPRLEADVEAQRTTPYNAARQIVDLV